MNATDEPAPKRTATDVARTGPNAVLAEEIPEAWMTYFAYDEWDPDDDGDPQWSRAEAARWAARYGERGYAFSGPDDTHERSPDDFNGLWGMLQRVFLTNQQVIDEDRAAGRFSIHGTDEKPSEYVLRAGTEAAVQLPTCFEPRIDNAEAEIHDPETADTSPDAGRGLPGAADRPDDAGATALDDAWTEQALDRTLAWLAQHGWRIECMLDGTERDGWYRQRWGRCALYLASRSPQAPSTPPRPVANGYAPLFHDEGPTHWPGDQPGQ